MPNADYLRAPLDPIGAMFIMGINYKTYRKLTDHGFLGQAPGAKQYIISVLQYHSFWDIVNCEARIHFNNYNLVDEMYVNQLLDEIAFELESEDWGDIFNETQVGFPNFPVIQKLSINTVEVECSVYQIIQNVATRFMAYLGAVDKSVSQGAQIVMQAGIH
ncbi:hypothetical protein J2X53_004487 [Pseudorhodobacter sp. 4114]|nr:hypothetical protein [Pseudorhodobacter sp. 4114]